MAETWVTVFGATGFLGRRIVARCLAHGLCVRVASRHPEALTPPRGAEHRVQALRADVRDAGSVAAASEGASGVVNAVGLYVEKGDATFHAVHVEGARCIARTARREGVGHLLHISGIGVDRQAASPYIRARAEGEAAVRDVFDSTTVFRPSVMFGPDDAFLNTLVSLVRRFPVLPLFGRGRTRLQPVSVENVGEAAAQVLSRPENAAPLYEIGGPEVYSYRELVELIMRRMERRRLLVPVPFLAWDALAAVAGLLPNPPLTEGQVSLLKRDNVAAPDRPGLTALGIVPARLQTVLADDFRLL
jgi:NADH dehydrogenase